MHKYVHSEVMAGCITVSGCNPSGRGCDATEMQDAVGRIEGRGEEEQTDTGSSGL